MFRMPSRISALMAIALASLLANPGCSDGSSTPIDTKATIEKATGGSGKAPPSEKAKAADEAAKKTHPKLY